MPLGWGFHVKPFLFFDIFCGDLFSVILIIGLFWICLFKGQTLGEVG